MLTTDTTTTKGDLRVADLMTIDPVTVAFDATIEKAEDLMRRHRVTGLPVVDEAGRLIGVISQTDILYLDVPAVQALIRHRERGVRVGEVMSAPALTIDSTATIQSAAIRMNDQHIHRLVAVDEHGRPGRRDFGDGLRRVGSRGLRPARHTRTSGRQEAGRSSYNANRRSRSISSVPASMQSPWTGWPAALNR